MIFKFENYSIDDIEILKKQLNRKEISICGIIKRCRYGFPQAILLNPVKEIDGIKNINYEAVSNIMWLTCPYLNFEIHELENSTYIKKIQSIIREDQSLSSMMLDAHANYYFVRDIIFRKYAFSFMIQDIDLFKTGIGGIRDLSSIKCLHLHFCHSMLSCYNVAGRMTNFLLDKKTDCSEIFCKNYTDK